MHEIGEVSRYSRFKMQNKSALRGGKTNFISKYFFFIRASAKKFGKLKNFRHGLPDFFSKGQKTTARGGGGTL